MLKTKYNATIGMATNKTGKCMLILLFDVYNHLSPDEVFPYAPPQGLEALRDLWQDKC